MIVIITFLLLSVGSVFSDSSVPNVIYLSFDGLSPQPLFNLMEKKKIANFHKMAVSGSSSILKGVNSKPGLKESLPVLWTGYSSNVAMSRNDSAFVFNRLKKTVPDLKSIVIISRPKRKNSNEKEWGTIVKRSPLGIDKLYDEKERTSDEVTQAIVESIKTSNGSFILFANYPLAAQIALNYREGCSRYSEAILYLNKQVGIIQDALKEKGIKSNTVFVLTASYTFIENSQLPSSKSWVICSKKLRPGNTLLDVVPTLYTLYGKSLL
jgi:hypothetical protein